MGGFVLAAVINWTMVITSLIVALPAIIAAVYAGRVHHGQKTPSGKSLGEVAEYVHDTVIANNLLLSHKNGPTRRAAPGDLSIEGMSPPLVPGPPATAASTETPPTVEPDPV